MVGVVAIALWRRFESTVPPVAYRSSLLAPPSTSYLTSISPATRFAVSPDGRRLAFVGVSDDGQTQLWVRTLDGQSVQPLAGTEGARSPFWSPDGRLLAFLADNKLKRVDASGGPIAVVCEVPGRVVRRRIVERDRHHPPGERERPSAQSGYSGGQLAPATTLDATPGATAHWFPFFLPDGDDFLFTSLTPATSRPCGPPHSATPSPYACSTPGPTRSMSMATSSYLQGTTLVSRQFDVSRLTITAAPTPVAPDIETGSIFGGLAAFSVAQRVLVPSRCRQRHDQADLVQSQRTGNRYVGEPGRYTDVELSDDGRRAAVAMQDASGGKREEWIFEVEHGTRRRLSFDGIDERRAVWSPDGSSVVVSSLKDGRFRLFRRKVDGSEPAELLLKDDWHSVPESWSPDGRFILFWSVHPGYRQTFGPCRCSVTDARSRCARRQPTKEHRPFFSRWTVDRLLLRGDRPS